MTNGEYMQTLSKSDRFKFIAKAVMKDFLLKLSDLIWDTLKYLLKLLSISIAVVIGIVLAVSVLLNLISQNPHLIDFIG